MGKKKLAVLLSAAVMGSCVLPASGADDIVMDTGSGSQKASEKKEDAGVIDDEISGDALFELVGESLSSKGKTLEDVMPEPVVAEVPAEPPSPNLTVQTLDPADSPKKALKKYRDEYDDADEKYCSDTLFYTCTKHDTDTGYYYLTHVVIADAIQICGEDSFGDFGGVRETPGAAAERTGAAIVTNGSYFRYDTNYATGGELLIRDNQVLHGPYSDGYEICLRSDGTLFSPGYNTIDSVLAQDVVFSWGTCEDLLIQDGEKCFLTDFDWNGYTYPRTAIGMVRPLEYYLITAGETGHAEGITIYEEQEIFSDLGCWYARGLDGGGSSALVIDGEYINENGDTSEDGKTTRRAVADFVLFYE